MRTPSAEDLLPVLAALRGAEADPGAGRRDAVARVVRSAFAALAAARGMAAGLAAESEADPEVGTALLAHGISFADLAVTDLGYLYESLIETGSRKHAGAHYTPRALADEVVLHALAPLVQGADGAPVSSAEILDLRVADIAAGSGVFLIAAAEYLAERLVEAWEREGARRSGGPPGGSSDALREVVTHCLYGADIDPFAVELCQRSLWLLAADPLLPLTFLDDRVFCGNALLGLVDASTAGMSSEVADAFVATGLRFGAQPGKELDAAYARLEAAVAAEDDAALEEIRAAGLTPTVPTDYARWQPVHWGLLVPDVLARGGFDAVIGNPPFLGVKNIRGALGKNLRDYLARTLLRGGSGRSDLVVFFLARAARLSRRTVGLVLPDAVSEGDSARHGPGAAIAEGFRIYRAETSRPWPSEAGVRIALLWLERRGDASVHSTGGTAVLDGVEVAAIGPGLGRTSSVGVAVQRLPPPWIPHGYQATIVLGKGLVLTAAQRAAILAEDPRAAAWIREYLSGDDLVSTVGPRSTRWVLDVGALEPAVWESVAPVARHLREVVLPERQQQWAKYPHLTERWWRFHNRVERLYDAMAGLGEVIALAKHAKYVWPVLVPVGPVFSNGTIVYPTQDRAVYGFLASEPHRLWAVEEGGSRLNQSHRYNPSRLLTTYPFPEAIDVVREPGEQLATAMGRARDQLGLGVTDLLNQVHTTTSPAPEIRAVRAAIAAVDRAVVAAHGFDLALEHDVRTAGSRTWFGLDATGTGLLRQRLLD